MESFNGLGIQQLSASMPHLGDPSPWMVPSLKLFPTAINVPFPITRLI